MLTPESIGQGLHEHWSRISTRRDLDRQAAAELRFVAIHPRLAEDGTWRQGCIRSRAHGVRDTAPGTDGFGCSFWAEARDVYHVPRSVGIGAPKPGRGKSPEVLASTATVTIPKVEMAQADATVRCTSSSFRPITLKRTSATLLALGLDGLLAGVAADSVAGP